MMGNIGLPTTRGEVLLDLIYDEVDQRLNPGGEECWYCGGEGATYDCIDDCCVDAESGCPDCERPCLECKLYAGRRARAVREEVIKANDVDIATAWLKSIKRWRDDITEDQIRDELARVIEKLAEKTNSNADSAGQTPAARSEQEGRGQDLTLQGATALTPSTGGPA
jgi:hypothetical protein